MGHIIIRSLSVANEKQALLVLLLKRLAKHFARECNLVPRVSVSFLGSLIFLPSGAREVGGEMRDPGNEVVVNAAQMSCE